MRVKLSLRSKFYILTLPSALALIGVLLLLILPHADVRSQVTLINESLNGVLSAEGFARHYERQLRECAAFIATGSTEHGRLYEQAKVFARKELGNWIEVVYKGQSENPADRRRDTKMLDTARASYNEVTRACEWAVAIARSGQPVAAMEHLEAAADGPDGTVISETLGEMLPEQEESLEGYLDNLDGAVNSLSIMRLMGIDETVRSMDTHVAFTILAERFARYYNAQVKESLTYLFTGDPVDAGEVAQARREAAGALKSWSDQLDTAEEMKARAASAELLARLDSDYREVNEAWSSAISSADSGDRQGALDHVENETGPSTQGSLTAAINGEVEAQKELLMADAEHISAVSTNAGWGVGIAGILVLLVALAGALLVSRMVVVPVMQLRDAARQFGRSGSGVAVNIKSRDEMGELAMSFNEMASARASAESELRKARDELEERVEERTRELEKLNEELLAANKELNDFAYVVSHDLKAPLRGIGSLASWLAADYEDVLDEQGKEQLRLLLDRAKRMEALIESVLQYSRIGRIRESMEKVDFNELVDAVLEMVDLPPDVSVTVPGRLPRVNCERTRMQQVLQNLIGNAVKFSDKPAGIVTVSCKDAGEFWEFAVADNGPGIDPRYHDQIFQIFQTLAPAGDKEDGTGIGLTLVKKIVEMHGGTVRVESEPGVGSTFFFTLPKE